MLISIVVPIYNEEQTIREFYRRLEAVMNTMAHPWEVWFVDDGSIDKTAAILQELMEENPQIGLVKFSRNFGHQAALSAGMDHADGDIVISMDGDGQHPPELIPELVELHQQGFEIVLTQRIGKQGSFFKHISSKTFYKLLSFISQSPTLPDSSDFRLISRSVVLGFRQMQEYHRFLRGLIRWLGFSWTVLRYKPEERIAGESKYSPRKMFRLAYDAVFSFSTFPIKIAILIGVFFLILAGCQLSHTLWLILQGRRAELVPGWTTLIFSILGVGGVQLIMLGIIGQYIGMIFQEVKRRPLYILERLPRVPTPKGEEGE